MNQKKYIMGANKQAKFRNTRIIFGTKHSIAKKDNPIGRERLRFQRDRDRIVWSPPFRRLAYKTQVFPHRYGDHHRCRLTHTLEVMQLSSSVARTLGINDILCESIALGHDLGHTPFGHAGEDALNNALSNIEFDPKINSISRFTHYEQGIDIISYMTTRENRIGLNLTDEVREGILKHTYDYSDAEGDDKPKNLGSIIKYSKYDNIKSLSKFGTIEGQVVRMCDKISYMISDLEDGIKIGGVHWDDLKEFEILKYAKPLPGQTEMESIISSRSKILKGIIDALLQESKDRLERIDHPARHERPDSLLVELSDAVKTEMNNIYKNVQKKFLFNNVLVERSNRIAEHIVSCLFCEYLSYPELLPWKFRSEYRDKKRKLNLSSIYGKSLDREVKLKCDKWYSLLRKKGVVQCGKKKKLKRRLCDIVAAKDYVAGMTDSFAELCFKDFVSCKDSRHMWETSKYDTWEFKLHT